MRDVSGLSARAPLAGRIDPPGGPIFWIPARHALVIFCFLCGGYISRLHLSPYDSRSDALYSLDNQNRLATSKRRITRRHLVRPYECVSELLIRLSLALLVPGLATSPMNEDTRFQGVVSQG